MSARRKARYITGTTTLNRWVQGPNCQRYLWGALIFCMKASQTLNKRQLRQQMRQRRRALSPLQQYHAGQQLYRQLCTQPLFQRAKHIALYLAQDGEIDPNAILKQTRKQHKTCYLPVLMPGNTLRFKAFRKKSRMKDNRFGIPEPQGNHFRRTGTLDLVLFPLVAFDEDGGRLGMGGGFYDRTFAWIRQHPKLRRPKLLGLAHHFQKVDQLKLESWDIPLDGIVTDKEILLLKG